MRARIERLTRWSLVVAALAGSGPVLGQSDETQALEAVRGQIEALEQRRAREAAALGRETAALREIELRVASARIDLERAAERVGAQHARLDEIDGRRAETAGRLAGERDALARQVRLSYMNGRAEVFRLLLSQQSPAALGRMLVYYDYLNRARTRRIEAVAADLDELARIAAEARAAQRELERLEADERRELAALEASRAERARVVAGLEGSLAAAATEVEALRAEEKRLNELVVELGELLAGFPVNADQPFAALEGRLGWPVPGRLAADFGDPRGAGSLRFNGVVIEAAAGTRVRAIHYGRVAFADWLPGLGLLIIVDHGGGYMSLYGHNEALLGESGDWVAPGEAIALVGDSGGRAEPSLYFEIRRNGEPVNPHRWAAGAPSPAD